MSREWSIMAHYDPLKILLEVIAHIRQPKLWIPSLTCIAKGWPQVNRAGLYITLNRHGVGHVQDFIVPSHLI